jgi:glutamine amidotransferase
VEGTVHCPAQAGLADAALGAERPDATIVDCGIGNIKSVQRMFEAVDGTAEIVSDPELVSGCRRLVLPGVGAFDAGMTALEEGGWIEALNQVALVERRPVLGICLGMQLLCRRSEEGVKPGLSWMDVDVVRVDLGGEPGLKLPHMGWAQTFAAKPNPLIPSDEGEQRFYYVHKYRAVCDRPEDVLATAIYGTEFTSAVHRDNIFGVQFHPEKSHRFGMALMRRFLNLPC